MNQSVKRTGERKWFLMFSLPSSKALVSFAAAIRFRGNRCLKNEKLTRLEKPGPRAKLSLAESENLDSKPLLNVTNQNVAQVTFMVIKRL